MMLSFVVVCVCRSYCMVIVELISFVIWFEYLMHHLLLVLSPASDLTVDHATALLSRWKFCDTNSVQSHGCEFDSAVFIVKKKLCFNSGLFSVIYYFF